MLFISNRGNLCGPNPEQENSLEYVKKALDKGYHVLVDVWLIGKNHLALGSVRPQYGVTLAFLKNDKILARARNVNTLTVLVENGVHCFSHEKDNEVLTSKGMIWCYPGKPFTKKCVVTMPEWVLRDVKKAKDLDCAGICSNFIEDISDKLETIDEVSNEGSVSPDSS